LATPHGVDRSGVAGGTGTQSVSAALNELGDPGKDAFPFWDDSAGDFEWVGFTGADTPTDGAFVVGDGTNLVLESGATARASLGASATEPADDVFKIIGSADGTKKARFEVDGVTAGATRVVAVGDRNFTIGKHATRQVFTGGSGTYTTPSACTRINVRLVGGGGGGAGSGTSPGAAAAGSNTTFSTFTGGGGGAGQAGNGAVGAAGTAAGGDINITGGQGGPTSGIADKPGGAGGVSVFGGNGPMTYFSTIPGNAARANSGSGGSGAGCSATVAAGGGGGAGGYVEGLITSPAATYSYAVGAGGAGGTLGTSGDAGGAGGSGIIIVDEWYD